MRYSPDERARAPRRAALRWLGRACAAAFAATVSCVSYDAVGPGVPAIDGTYATTIAVEYSNSFEYRTDTLVGSITLWTSHYRGHFDGFYSISGDSGSFAGVLRPEGVLTVTDWGALPKPIAYVGALRRLYPWCDFPLLGSGTLPGELHGDTLVADGTASVPCSYWLFGQISDIGTQLSLHIVGVR